MPINILPEEVFMKIAAGEVVTNPAAVVKELIENSLDAETTLITLEITNGGNESIIIRDNGKGMEETDLKKCILPHSTSKIAKWEDLLDLNTFGFRGEALASICAVSHMYVSSKTSESEFGTRISYQGGVLTEEKKVSMNVGTEIEVRNIFYNVPARRKFLKSPGSEGRKIIDIVERFLISNPDIGFKIIKDGKIIYDVKPEELNDRLSHIYKNVKTSQLLEVNYVSEDLISIVGYTTPPNIFRPNRNGITFFVNGRYVKDGFLYSAISKGYGNTLEKGKFPVSVLMLSVPPNTVDVNIHPQKLEVKFSNSETIYSSIIRGIKAALGSKPIKLEINSEKDVFSNLIKNSVRGTDYYSQSKINEEKIRIQDSIFRDNLADRKKVTEKNNNNFIFDSTTEVKEDQNEISYEVIEKDETTFFKNKNNDTHILPISKNPEFKYLCTANKRYIIGEENDEFVIIDFHAAHEAVIFHDLKNNRNSVTSQSLLIPIVFSAEASFLETSRIRKKRLNMLGFDFKITENEIVIERIPVFIHINSAQITFIDVVNELSFLEIEEESQVFDRVFSTMACRSALKSGDFISREDAEILVNKMYERNVFSCPHGRPVKFSLSFHELDNYFKRV